jgi:hypothetical protein
MMKLPERCYPACSPVIAVYFLCMVLAEQKEKTYRSAKPMGCYGTYYRVWMILSLIFIFTSESFARGITIHGVVVDVIGEGISASWHVHRNAIKQFIRCRCI